MSHGGCHKHDAQPLRKESFHKMILYHHSSSKVHYEHKHIEQDTANTALRTAGQTKNMGDTVLKGADVKVRT